MTQQAFTYEDPFRPIFEYHALSGWLATALIASAAPLFSTFPAPLFYGLSAFCCVMAGLRALGAIRIGRRQRALNGQTLTYMTRAQLREKCRARIARGEPPAVFLGYGFAWTQEHAQLAHQMVRHDPSRVVVPENVDMGQPWLHGIGMGQEEEIWVPLDHLKGGTLLVGTTRAGKSRTLDSIIAQCVDRGECVICFDPKGDPDLMNSMKRACEENGRPNDFVYLHPAWAEKSVRLDPLASFSRATELASRIAALIPSESGSDPFKQHSQMVLTSLCEGLLMINRKPTLKLLYSYISSGPEGLVVKAAEAYFTKHLPDWRVGVEPYLRRAKGRSSREYAIAYIAYYREVVQESLPSVALEGLFHDFEHDRTHQQKMTASLHPVLKQLCADPLGDLLSPNPHADDPRPITDFASIIRNRQCAYIGLDSLSDPMVGSCLGSVFISDLAAMAGARYNYQDVAKLPPINIIVDELAELIGNERLLQIANKGAGAGTKIIFATQTLADISAKLGSPDKARQVLGNLNNVVSLRCLDGETQEYLCEAMPKTYVKHLEYAQSTDTSTNSLIDFKYRVSESLKETEVPLVQPPHLGCLPNLEFWARVSGGRVIKARIPILQG